jgi:hypothetical protein
MGTGRISRSWPTFLTPAPLLRNSPCGVMGYLCPAESAAIAPPMARIILRKSKVKGAS